MAKKIATIILTVIILAALGVLAAFLIIKDTPQGQSVTETVKNFFPFGKAPENSSSLGTTEDTQTQQTNIRVASIPRLRKITDKPIAGATSISGKSGTSTIETVRFMERATGNVFDNRTDSLEVVRVSNTTIPKVYEALWGNDGGSVYARYLNDSSEIIETLYARLSKATSTTADTGLRELVGTYLPENLQNLALSQSGKIFFTQENSGVVGITADPSGGKPVVIFTSQFSEWLTDWPAPNTIVMSTKPAADIPGFLYFLNPQTGGFINILQNIPGLTALADQNASELIYGSGTNGRIRSFLYVVKNASTTPLSVATLPEKCVWSKKQKAIFCAVPRTLPAGDYPDSWYQGLVAFSDDIWKIDTVTGASVKIADLPELARTEIDAVELSLTPSENYLIFVNKRDNAPWILRIAADTATHN